MEISKLDSVIGKTLISVAQWENDERISFVFSDGTRYEMLHQQDCCESVVVEDVVGSYEDLIGQPLLDASERVSDDPDADESGRWTFYHFTTIKGTVVIRWYGSSNGYYSEDVSFYQVEPEPDAKRGV